MKKYFLLSLLLHLSLVLAISFKMQQEEKQQQTEQGQEGSESDKKGQDVGIEIIEISDTVNTEDQKKKELKNFYWGIGITSSHTFSGPSEYVEVVDVASGYSAESAGLQRGDIIMEIDGLPISNINDIRGDKPRKMLLTINRKGVIVRIQIERVKVYY